jgi:hypothetical protein
VTAAAWQKLPVPVLSLLVAALAPPATPQLHAHHQAHQLLLLLLLLLSSLQLRLQGALHCCQLLLVTATGGSGRA